MIKNRIKKNKCSYHPHDRDISEYVFWHTDTRKPKHVNIYECKLCKERLDRDINRSNRIRENNRIQEEAASKRREEKFNKKIAKLKKSREENIWDDEVKNELCKGLKLTRLIKYQFKESIPKEVLQLKRASLKLEKLLKKVKKKILEEKKQTKYMFYTYKEVTKGFL